ncbi:carbamoyl-phosphate synthase [Catenaria anguillulae PL171]|uniref:Carbamoyl-phosphate synthase n=1 Tax=Catenaria anguillulae PL171 TaxID=765915 RepID=A0A1Y2HGR3_9FUNG|nr:carbamoyl-phosphate synthase [Catenaria anguillulae PL171]
MSLFNLVPTASSLAIKRSLQSTLTGTVPASFTLATGHTFSGACYGAPTSAAGEVVFTTALVGYPESLTDPSYAGQILVLTQPLAGNYGVPAPKFEQGLSEYYESARIHAKAVIVQDYSWQFSHRQAVSSLGAWCAAHGVPLVSGVDTRALVGVLREQGSTMGSVQVVGGPAVALPPPASGPHLVASVSTKAPQVFGKGGKYKLAVMDYGVKHNILRSALKGGETEVTLLPWDFPIDEHAHKFDGILLSNGPGDPKFMTTPVKHVLGMAAGMKTYKLKYGNRGHNQPCIDLIHGGKCVITSQNHGYCLDDSTMPEGWQVYLKNANDGSNEGIWAAGGRWKAVQFHPEAWGGPTDTLYMFDEFKDQVKAFHECGSLPSPRWIWGSNAVPYQVSVPEAFQPFQAVKTYVFGLRLAFLGADRE